jgi:hypothetical protein
LAEELMQVALLALQSTQSDSSSGAGGILGAILGGAFIFWLVGFVWYSGLCLIIAKLASQKGHTGWLWFVFSCFVTPLIAAVFLAGAAQRPTAWSMRTTVQELPMPGRRTEVLLP